jgi:ubiquinone/menaquinone biosynthesis C-methylase UbiE
MSTTTVTQNVQERYSRAAQNRENSLCCPVDYRAEYLKVLPEEVIEKDYGCGDPSRYLKPGETVLDLGSGSGKICFIAAQVVGPTGRVIGVDMTDEMLVVARRNAPIVAEKIGYANVEFRKGRIEDLALDLDLLEKRLAEKPISGANQFLQAQDLAEKMRRDEPLIPANSVDVVVSNCVLNLVDPKLKPRLFQELFRVLKVGGRAVISDIVADSPVPPHLQQNSELWSGCISGALTEIEFLRAFETAGFYGIQLLKREVEPWRTVEGIHFRSVTVQAFKTECTCATDQKFHAIYLGPFKEAVDDEGCSYLRGQKQIVCERTAQLLSQEPYKGSFLVVPIPNNKTVPSVPIRLSLKGGASISVKKADDCSRGSACC